ncbi:MAG: hypothetical protein IKW19_00780 [Akkermansia sp.]|nr:hypothetical protein [Akkermansia sp.]
MNKVIQGRAFLEARAQGAFEALCDYMVVAGGVLHMAPDCLLAGYELPEEAGVFHVVFQCSELPALYRELVATGCEWVEWRREYDHSSSYGLKRRRVADFGRKLGLAEILNSKKKEIE